MSAYGMTKMGQKWRFFSTNFGAFGGDHHQGVEERSGGGAPDGPESS